MSNTLSSPSSELHQALPWTLRAIARLERSDNKVRQPRLTEPDLASFSRMRRKLNHADFIEILHEDLAGAFPLPFEQGEYEQDLFRALDDSTARSLIAEAQEQDVSDVDALTFLRRAASALGVLSGGKLSELRKVQPSYKVLELPGSGGRIAAQQLSDNPTLSLEQFTIVADSDVERALVGLVRVELRGSAPEVISSVMLKEMAPLTFDLVVGIDNPRARSLADDLGLNVNWA